MPKVWQLFYFIGKTLAAAGMIFLAVASYQYSRLSYLIANDPAQALASHPDGAIATAGYLAQRFNENPQFEASKQDLTNIHTALRRQPLDAELLSFLALQMDRRGQSSAAKVLMKASNKVSRRDALTQLWLIENASASSDVGTALRHYHAALSVHPELRATLLPVLAAATAYPEVRTALRPYLSAPSLWTDSFLKIATTTASTSDIVALLHPIPAGIKTDSNRPALAQLLKRLAMEGGDNAAIQFAGELIPGFDHSTLTSLPITMQTRDPRLGSLAWMFPDVEGIDVSVNDSGEIQASIQPLAKGTLASRELIVTKNTSYILRQRVSFSTEASKAQLKWKGACLYRDREEAFWEQKIPPTDTATTYQMKLTIPSDCQLIRLTASASGPDGQLPNEVKLTPLMLEAADHTPFPTAAADGAVHLTFTH